MHIILGWSNKEILDITLNGIDERYGLNLVSEALTITSKVCPDEEEAANDSWIHVVTALLAGRKDCHRGSYTEETCAPREGVGHLHS